MNCVSTRGHAPAVSFTQAVRAGLAPDGGLYVPSALERRPDAFWSALRGKTFHNVAIAVLSELAGDEFDAATLTNLIREALNFPVRIIELKKGLGVVELFHGPTFAFKDFGARTLARFLALSEHASPGQGDLTILVATSGDTGSAVAHAFHGVAGIRVVVMYPEGQVSAIQEAQFTTLGGNVTAVAVQGTFDDCQRLAKEAFADSALQARVRLTSANSISLGRLIPQMFYYAYAAVNASQDNGLTISVPSGNFGNLVAGVMAWKMGAPITAFTAPTTINDTVPRYFETGRVEPRRSVPTLANAMDVGHPSNLERLQWLFHGDLDAARGLITSRRHTDDEVREAIVELHKQFQYVVDPHTAIGYLGARQARSGHSTGALFLATAHPAKFREVVEPIIGTSVAVPEPLAATLERQKVVERIQPALGELSKLL
ncbi:MAG: threonine synthase [Acidobacteriota bacterium]|jgi:threonine synthase